MAQYEYKLPLSDTAKETLSKVYEEIYLKKPHHRLTDESLLKAVNIHKPEHKLYEPKDSKKEIETEDDATEAQDLENDKDTDYENEVEQYVKNFGAKPKANLSLEALQEANKTYAEAKAKTPSNAPKKKAKKSVNKNLIQVTDGKDTIYVNPQTFEMFLKKTGWKKAVNKPKEIQNGED